MTSIHESIEFSETKNQIILASPVSELTPVVTSEINVAGVVVAPVKLSRTPSPNNSGQHKFDDIVLASDIIDSLSERKEPNGKVYFVDEGRGEKLITTDLQQRSIEEASSAIALLDDVLQREEKEKNETSTVAVIHLQHDGEEGMEEENEKDTKAIDSNTQAIDAISDQPFDVSVSSNLIHHQNEIGSKYLPLRVIIPSQQEQNEKISTPKILISPAIDYDIEEVPEQSSQFLAVPVEIIEPENSEQFKERLTMLLVQNIQPDKSNKQPPSPPPPPPLTPVTPVNILSNARSESDINQLLLAEIRARNGETEPITKLEIPRVKIGSLVPEQATIVNTTNVPPPPIFNPVLYNTLGKNRHASNEMSEVVVEENYAVHLRPRAPPPDYDNDDDDDEQRMSSIRDKLEKIYSRGPMQYSRPITVVPVAGSPEPNPVTDLKIQNKAEESLEQVKRPYDTVHKQKAIFSDVLKSLNSNARPSLTRIRAPVQRKVNTIDEAKSGLRPITPSIDYPNDDLER